MSHFVTVRLHVKLSSHGTKSVMVGPFESRSAAEQWVSQVRYVAWSYSDCRYDAEAHVDMHDALKVEPTAEHFGLMDPTSVGVHLFEHTFFGDKTLAYDTAQPANLIGAA